MAKTCVLYYDCAFGTMQIMCVCARHSAAHISTLFEREICVDWFNITICYCPLVNSYNGCIDDHDVSQRTTYRVNSPEERLIILHQIEYTNCPPTIPFHSRHSIQSIGTRMGHASMGPHTNELWPVAIEYVQRHCASVGMHVSTAPNKYLIRDNVTL